MKRMTGLERTRFPFSPRGRDGFMCVGFTVIGALLLMLLLGDPPAKKGLVGG
jgi:hypothetical protein